MGTSSGSTSRESGSGGGVRSAGWDSGCRSDGSVMPLTFRLAGAPNAWRMGGSESLERPVEGNGRRAACLGWTAEAGAELTRTQSTATAQEDFDPGDNQERPVLELALCLVGRTRFRAGCLSNRLQRTISSPTPPLPDDRRPGPGAVSPRPANTQTRAPTLLGPTSINVRLVKPRESRVQPAALRRDADQPPRLAPDTAPVRPHEVHARLGHGYLRHRIGAGRCLADDRQYPAEVSSTRYVVADPALSEP